ncbi:MAG TPA: type II toxin-antitoxin system RelB/DinJ family antitoxin [Candidatus Eisenbergiella stercorigallinarum]|uniref:Type II toxin-antitoxin system RelB/DinJ family antitoxin n=1 Tax=Candidatus Eisenbergiella stercorigallinarum TaxID=2838557 RepID=A0A9D2QZM0_9FIRM|nr:type II toxin-antitoxin system RelB/DinJ family antitoxin [Candidatus Eisenbergiella stercorigallinarum]
MAQISLRIEDDVKRKAEEACNEIGLSLSAAINIYLKKLGREKRIPFEVSVDPFYSEENMDRLRKSIAQMEATGGTIHEVKLDDQGMV